MPDPFDEIPLDKHPNPEREVLRFETPEEREKHLRNVNLEQDINERRKFASRSFRLTYVWIIFIILSTITQFVLNAIGRGLPVADFIALITTTSATVFGFWLLVGRYLFPASVVKHTAPARQGSFRKLRADNETWPLDAHNADSPGRLSDRSRGLSDRLD